MRSLLLSIALFASACRGPEAAPPAIATPAPVASAPSVVANEPSAPAPVLIRLERSPCLGTCPIYKLTIHTDGRWLLGSYYPHKGCAEGTLPAKTVSALVDRVKAIRYFELKDEYKVNVTDMPSTDTEVTLDGKSKKIHHYGSSTAPGEKELTEFELAVDEAVGSSQLVAAPLGKCNGKGPYPDVP